MALALVEASKDELKSVMVGFDGKFIVAPGFSLKISKDMKVFKQDSGFKYRSGDHKGEPIITYYLAKDPEAKKLECVTFSALQRGTVPARAEDKTYKGKDGGMDVDKARSLPVLMDSRMSIADALADLDGKTIELIGVTSYTVKPDDLPKFTARSYHWQIQ